MLIFNTPTDAVDKNRYRINGSALYVRQFLEAQLLPNDIDVTDSLRHSRH